ncbi:uncharacterized protein GIQ15_01065 [Arthroderma uncinatum]|uniref:uncharacterized protein n=1 Tax=Arthroderma uncinatum TaxID=74035 RepID=UPI00144AE547|nr:uncharacterized protein GIQ15_01065 [Arthroderma uncinatum]KAF3491548.1 hypothetical protein GIQ15_01065 [Arthroderma uncinatum]
MATAKDVQSLLRFLTQDARLPLAAAMGKIKDLQKAKLLNPDDISKAKLATVQLVFTEDKTAKQVWNAAKRVVKKRLAAENDPQMPSAPSPSKKRKASAAELDLTPQQIEASLALPMSTDLDKISETAIIINRAPLVLAFAVISLKYTMPEQPLSSRLSLAQAVVSANSRTKASSIGIDSTPSAEDEGWAKGQPTVRVLGRSISVLRRIGYDWKGDRAKSCEEFDSKNIESSDSPHAEKGYPVPRANVLSRKQNSDDDNLPALWGLDLESLRKSSDGRYGRHGGGYDSQRSRNAHLPVYRAESARDYLLRAFSTHNPGTKKDSDSMPAKEMTLGLLLGAIDHVCQSWASKLSKDELDRRAWCWYVAVRPEVENGIAGWGQKGTVRLSAILDLGVAR